MGLGLGPFCTKIDTQPPNMNQTSETLFHSLGIKIAQKPCIIGSLGPRALKYDSFEGKGSSLETRSPGRKTRFPTKAGIVIIMGVAICYYRYH